MRKINYYTYSAKAGGEAVKSKCLEAGEDIVYYHDIAVWGRSAIKEDVMAAMKIFCKNGNRS